MSLLSRLAVQAARAYGILSSGATTIVPASYLVVAGGGSGGQQSNSGGGGAGGFRTSAGTTGGGGSAESAITLSTLNTYSIVVGAGGAAVSTANSNGNVGNNSSISGTGLTTLTSTGGGYGGNPTNVGGTGGSGGGSGYTYTSFGGSAVIPTQGNGGGRGAGSTSPSFSAGGGGGAGGAGGNGTGAVGGGIGGAGLASSISGSSVTYAGGGGGTNDTSTTQAGGSGGGGRGGAAGTINGVAGTANTGSGGGGAFTSGTSGAGGSGIVIISYTSATPRFVGGTLTTSGGNQIHTFTSSGTLSPITPITASYLVVAGGAGGGSNRSTNSGGGGGAGGLLTSSTTLYSGATYVVTVGAGGAGSTASTVNGANGTNSVLSGTGLTTVTSTGGGGGGDNQAGSSGGSGGGGGSNGGSNAGGAASPAGQGNAGGSAVYSVNYPGGGGGGAGAVGGNATSTVAGNGGAGTASSISGSSVTYAGGGGGGNSGTNTVGTGGSGGGGDGANNTTSPVSGTTNSGGGGGGVGYGGAGFKNGAAGGSGVVIISYAGSQAFNGGLVTSSGGNTIHTFLASGALTPLTNNLTNSLRFRSSASASLNRTFGTPTSQNVWTWSAWVKRGSLGGTQGLFGWNSSGNPNEAVYFGSDALTYTAASSGGTNNLTKTTTQVFRDPSAWYHIVIQKSASAASSLNAIQIYVNGNQITAWGTNAYTGTQASVPNYINVAGNSIVIGAAYGGNYFDGYMTDINFIDGQALEPYYFGNNDANGVWKPILYKGMYGTNGFYLPFSDTSALTSGSNTGVGKDFSGNGNYWNSSNISITAGTTYDAMTDVPTNTSATTANYPTWNPLKLYTSSAFTLSNANLTASDTTSAISTLIATMSLPTTGKWYWEVTVTAISAGNGFVGAIDAATANGNTSIQSKGAYRSNGTITNLAGTVQTTGTSYTSGDIIGVAVDVDAGTVQFYKNNAGQGATPSFSFTAGTELFPYIATDNNAGTKTFNANFGQRPFSYTPPTGFTALNTFNLPTPTILQGNKYMDASLYSGTGAALTVINAAQFKPDFVWMKGRSNVRNNNLYDSVRGTTKELNSNTTVAETTNATGLTAFNSNGWTIGSDGGINTSSETYVGWQWQAGQGSTTTGTGTGGITSVTQSVNTTAGFSIVTYTGSGANGTVTHGLGVAPKMVMVKWRSGGGLSAQDWNVYHTSVGATARLFLNTTAASATTSVAWNNTAPTSSVFSIGTGTDVNGSGAAYVAYCWAEIAGFSKFGSYTGNGSTDGPFVYTGFRPKFIIIKCTSNADSWYMLDTSRSTYNATNQRLFANASSAESSGDAMDILSNGFKNRSSTTLNNLNGGTYIYMAFAENPFKNSNAR